MSDDKLTPAEERDNIIRVMRMAAANDGAHSIGSAVCARIADLIEAPCAEEVAAAKLEIYSTIMGELADGIELVTYSASKGVLVKIETDTYRTIMKNRTEPTT